MIDTLTESVLTFSQAADELPRRRRGRKTHVSTLYRWATAGCRGVVLETIQIGGSRCTSREALQRFFERLSVPPGPASSTLVPASVPRTLVLRSEARRLQDSERAARELEAMGA